jgi:hypothetical protein
MAESGYFRDMMANGGMAPFSLGAASTKFSGIGSVNKFGENLDVDGAEDIWDYGSTYVFSTSADITKIISSAADTATLQIEGLDADYNEVTQTATLNGTTFVTLTTPLMRVFRMENIGSTSIAGGVYCVTSTAEHSGGVPSQSTDVRAFINNGNNQTLMAIYTVPAGKTAYMTNYHVTLGRAITSVAHMYLMTSTEGGVLKVKDSFEVDNDSSVIDRFFNPYFRIEEKSDIKFKCNSVTASNTEISAGFDLVLVDN